MVEGGGPEPGAVRIGVFGGTFDPIHYGHLIAAQEVLWALNLERVLFAPAGLPPHKRQLVISPIEQRIAMVELAIGGNPAFGLSRVDADRPGPAYTVDTALLLQQQLGPAAELSFIIGLDSLNEILTWREPQRLISLVDLAVVTRPGYAVPDMGDLERILPGVSQRVRLVDMPEIGISASDLRRRVAAGQPIKYQVPELVERYIYQNGLYAQAAK